MSVTEGILWSGDNPYIRLHNEASGALSAVASLFRVQYSPVGLGKALFLSTGLDGKRPVAYCMGDRPELVEWLRSRLVTKFTGFRDVYESLEDLPIIGATFETEEASVDRRVEKITGDDHSITLIWQGLKQGFYVDFEHGFLPNRLLAAFVPAAAGAIEIDGHRLPGSSIDDQFEGRQSNTACLALSETWLPVDHRQVTS